MKDQLWQLFFDYKAAYYYYLEYCRSAAHKKRIASIVFTAASMTFIGSWYFSRKLPLLWAVLTFLCQLASVLQPFFPYEMQVHAANYICRDLNSLTREMEYKWHLLEIDVNTEDISALILEFQEKYDQIESRFAENDTFPEDADLRKKAEENATHYFKRFDNHFAENAQLSSQD